jgi:hypothetical protein
VPDLLPAEDLGRTYTGEGGIPRLGPRWLTPGRLRLGLVWRDMGKTSEAREVLQKAEATLQAQPEPDLIVLENLAAIDAALADLAGPGAGRTEYDRKTAAAFRRAVVIAESGSLAVLATDPVYARLRARPELQVLLWDRMFPSKPFAPKD